MSCVLSRAQRTSALVLMISLSAACGGSVAPAAPQGAGESAPQGGDSDQASPSGSGSPAGGAAAAHSPEPVDAKTVDDCKALAQEARPDFGETTATIAKGATSERLLPMVNFMRDHRPGFRCCFDIWADKIPEAKLYVQVTFNMKLDKDGKLMHSTVTRTENDPYVAAEVEKCLKDVAASLTYPKSESGMETDYTHRFDFKPRKRRRASN